ncbi:MAG: hypothetical protein HXX17_11995 [Geobacteraceae bacterium]|nr:hypothetical protein [Geobacteraceae bacterium]
MKTLRITSMMIWLLIATTLSACGSQQDYDINNADANTGIAVRAAINAALQALASNNSGATAPTTTYAYMWWADTGTGTLWQRDAANSTWINKGPLANSYNTLSEALNETKGADIASAATTDIGAATGNYIKVTGTTTITALGTAQAGVRRMVEFTGILTLTHNATSLILPGAVNISTTPGDVATFISLGAGGWKCVSYMRANSTTNSGVWKLSAVNVLNSITASSSGILEWAQDLYDPDNTHNIAANATASIAPGTPTVVTLASHGLSPGQPVKFTSGTVPSGMALNRVYWVRSGSTPTTNTFEITGQYGSSQLPTTGSTGTATMTVRPFITAPEGATKAKATFLLPVYNLPAGSGQITIRINMTCPTCTTSTIVASGFLTALSGSVSSQNMTVYSGLIYPAYEGSVFDVSYINGTATTFTGAIGERFEVEFQ